MKLIMENWKGFEEQIITETQVRSLVTTWSRAIMTLLTHKTKNSNPEDTLREAFNIQYNNWSWKLGKDPYADGFQDGLPDEYSGSSSDYRGRQRRSNRKVGISPIEVFNLRVILRSSEHDSRPFVVAGSFGSKDQIFVDANSEYSLERTELNIKIIINELEVSTVALFRKQLENIRIKITEALAHELTHARQAVTASSKTVELGKDLSYYMSSHEVEAHARGYYEEAKRFNLTFEDVVNKNIENIKKTSEFSIEDYYEETKKAESEGDSDSVAALHKKIENKDELVRGLSMWKSALMAYARAQLPCAQKINGQPLYPKGCKPDKEEGSIYSNMLSRFKSWAGI
jgi:hypothetical protein